MPTTATPEFRTLLRKRANSQCECTMKVCGHSGRCPKGLFSWEAHRINSNGDYSLSNCVAMCAECHKNTRTYGRPR